MSMMRDNLFSLARSNDQRRIEKLFINDNRGLDERDDNGLTALHICATYGSVEACAILLKLGAKHSLQDFESGWTPLHRAFYFGNLEVSLLLIRAGAQVADEGEKRDWRTGVFCRRERWRSIRNLAKWKANIDHDGLSPLDLLSLSLCQNLKSSKKELLCTSVLSFGKADFTLGVPLPNSVENIRRPRRIEPLSGESVAQIVASRYHSLALTVHGEVYSWGHGRAGRLGHGDENTQPEPRLLTMLSGLVVRMISAGCNHSLVITNTGDLYSWGSDRFGQLGYGGGEAGKGSFHPKKVEHLKKHVVVAIAAGDAHSVCFTDNGEIYSWGCNKEGQLGIALIDKGTALEGGSGISTPRRVYVQHSRGKAKDVKESRYQNVVHHCNLLQIVASRCSTLLLCRAEDYIGTRGSGLPPSNEVYQWGHGSPHPSRVQFTRTTSFSGCKSDSVMDRFFGHRTTAAVNIVQLSAGLYHNVALSSTGYVYTWGLGSDQLGHGSLENRLSVPQLLETLLPENGGGRIVVVSAANDRTCVVSDVGDLYTWGATAEKGILGLGAMNYQPIPKLVEGVKRAVSVAAGGDYTLVLTSASVPPMPFISAHGPSIDISRHTTTPLKTDNTPSKLQNATEGNLVIVGGLYNSRRNKNIVPQLSPTLASSSLDSAESVDSDDDSDSDSDEEENAGEEDNSVEEFVEEEVDSDDETFQERLLPQENKQLGLLNALTPAGCERRLLSLQELCEQRIAASVDTRNAVALLAHAESIHAKALTEFCSQFIHSNLDAILVQSRPADLDILIADLSSYDYAGLSSGKAASTANVSVLTANVQGSGGGSIQNTRNGLTRKLSLEDLEWHSKDSKHNRSGSSLGIKFDGNSCKSSTKEGYDCGNMDYRGSPSISRTDSMGNDMYAENNGCDENGMLCRVRSQSKDFDSLSSVLKIIRSTKKKIQSIEELEARMKDGSLQDFNDEQIEKISKKETTQAEMRRLKLIFTRLEGEERVKAAAKALREREKDSTLTTSQSDLGELGDDKSQPSELLSARNVSTIQAVPIPVSASVPAPAPAPSLVSPLYSAPSSQNSKSRIKAEPKAADEIKSKSNVSTLKSTAPTTDIKNTAAASKRPTEPAGRILPSKSTASVSVPPSFNDWLKATDELIPAQPSSIKESSSDTKVKPEAKTAWGLKAITPTVPGTGGDLRKGLSSNLGAADARPVHEISISHIGSHGRTVLSPPLSKAGSNSGSLGLSSPGYMSSPPLKVPMSMQSNEGDKAFNRDQSSVEKQPVQGASYSLSLADLMITPNKRSNKQKRDTAPSVSATEKAPASELLEIQSKPSCPWLSPSITTPQAKTHPSDPVDTPVQSTATKVKQKTLSEIQVEEEAARLQSNLMSLKGNNNPWYQERRKRADSIEAVIRSQAEEKILDEANRIEEENAIRQVDLLKKRERRDRGKNDRNKKDMKSDVKSNAKPTTRGKKEPNTLKDDTSISSSTQPTHAPCTSTTNTTNTTEGNEPVITAKVMKDKKVRNDSEGGRGKKSMGSEGQCPARPRSKAAPRPNPRNAPHESDVTAPSDGVVSPLAANALHGTADSHPSSSAMHHPTRTVNACKSSGSKKKGEFDNRADTVTGDRGQESEGQGKGTGPAVAPSSGGAQAAPGNRNHRHRDRKQGGGAPLNQSSGKHSAQDKEGGKREENIDSPSCIADGPVN